MSNTELKVSKVSSKRKRNENGDHKMEETSIKRAKPSHKNADSQGEMSAKDISRLAEDISKFPKNYNSLLKLLEVARSEQKHAGAATLALCRVLSELIVDRRFKQPKDAEENDLKVLRWLRKRRDEFDEILWSQLKAPGAAQSRSPVLFVMQLVKSELAAEGRNWIDAWTGDHYFRKLIKGLATGQVAASVARVFTQEWINKYDDVRHYAFTVLGQVLQSDQSHLNKSTSIHSLVEIVETLNPPQAESDFRHYLHDYSKEQLKAKQPPSSLSESQRQAQKAFSKIFACRLALDNRKALLKNLSTVIVPWLQVPTQVLDFLTDSFDAGGSTSLLALSGLYNMMTTYNMDYPSFYTKLYSLLDENLLHSSHRSRFFRLLNEFLGSSHLPAAMVASFIKRLSRLALHGPSAAVVAIVPWVYNMMQTHLTCTFMIHREPRNDKERDLIGKEGASDPFDMSEPDPMNTKAIDSCLWELETLQSHFHPNVASLTNVISQEFRKQSYNLEDFLDHSYSSLVAGDLGKEMKKPPVVEFEIPKQIFTSADGDDTLADMMMDMLGQA